MSQHDEPVEGDAPTVHSAETRELGSHVRSAPGDSLTTPASDEERYDIEDELGRGGMGVVLKARDRRLGRRIALKVLHPDVRGSRSSRHRFLLEAQIGAQLEHPNIVPVYAMEHHEGGPAFAMRLLGQRTLLDYIDDVSQRSAAGHLPAEHRLEARLERFLKVCDAVEYAHARGVIHRDLKPSNVVLGEHNEVYLVDWGVAKVLGDAATVVSPKGASDGPAERSAPAGAGERPVSAETPISVPAAEGASPDTVTRYGDMVGTVTYMPPEQASGKLELHGPGSDQYALGLMLQYLVCLREPRSGPMSKQVVLAVEGRREPLGPLPDGRAAPPALAAMVRRATEPDVVARYPSVAALAEDVRAFLRGDEVSVLPDPLVRRVWKRLSRHPGAVLGAVAGVVLALSLGVAASSYQTVVAERRAAAQSARLSELTGLVVSRGEAIDGRFATSRVLVEGFAMSAEGLLAADQPMEGPLRYGAAGWLVHEPGSQRLEGLHDDDRYGFPVTFATPSYLYPRDVAFETVEPMLRALGPLPARLRETMLTSYDANAWSWRASRQDDVLLS